MKKIVFKESLEITKETVKVGDSFILYRHSSYSEMLYKVKVLEKNRAHVKLECTWYAISDGYDFGCPQRFVLKKNNDKWLIEGRIYKGKLIMVFGDPNYPETGKLITHTEFCDKYFGMMHL